MELYSFPYIKQTNKIPKTNPPKPAFAGLLEAKYLEVLTEVTDFASTWTRFSVEAGRTFLNKMMTSKK